MDQRPTATLSTASDHALVQAVLERVAGDLSSVIGREVGLIGLDSRRERARPAGKDTVHISFKLGLRRDGGPARFGALLVPLPEAVSVACYLLMLPEDGVAARRAETTLDWALKDALLEVGNMVGNASNTALASLGAAGWSARSEGCQGVRPDVRPAFPYEEGSDLIVGRATARIEPFPPFELLLILPALD
jgi:hypothetical protein